MSMLKRQPFNLPFSLWILIAVGIHILIFSLMPRHTTELPRFTVRENEFSMEAHFVQLKNKETSPLVPAETVDILSNDQSDTVLERELVESVEPLIEEKVADTLELLDTGNVKQSKCPMHTIADQITQAKDALQSQLPASPEMLGAQVFKQAALLSNPEPRYPKLARQLGHEGIVRLSIQVGIDGQAKTVRVLRSSGYAELDNSARSTILKCWRFAPATQDEQAVDCEIKMSVEFKLKRKSSRRRA